ncbi:MAG: esterase family protein [Planctomycetaceae bacterium]|nr:esterase family protein [Planctomycetaceae bacterium]
MSTVPDFSTSCSGDEDPDAIYVPGPDSQVGDVPHGVIHESTWSSHIFEGTTREYSLYIPAQYDESAAACLMVFQDGHAYVDPNGQFRVPVVMDNLIHRKEVPVTVCLFINPGHKGDTFPENRWRASNRSLEYDTLSDQYARFVMEELLPHVVQEHGLNLSNDPADRAICGISSGGICAFTAAWEHPEWFGKVLSHVGSFTNIRGGHNYEAMIRKTDRKPIRIFLQDGSNDLNNQHGNWWLANLQMESALAFKAYDFKFVGGTGKHSGKHGGAILPDSLRWLWRDRITSEVRKLDDRPLPE